ncbi:flavodoxin family protein [Candidatus Micrarchaeota archaeon]|jgi:multimeric flavodoxin WrbA|nr:flavodoxin family protein [Candidatus Micrarchaeota archaeon]
MKCILISGSPRKGNTEFVLSEIFKGIKGEKEFVLLKELKFNHCKGCCACYKTGECVIDDDMKLLFNKLLWADVIILGSPLYYGNVSGLTKQFIDRTIPAYESKSLKDKYLISIVVGGGKVTVTEKFHKQSIEGFIKFNLLNLIGLYNFEAFEDDDLKKDPNSKEQINNIIKNINSL